MRRSEPFSSPVTALCTFRSNHSSLSWVKRMYGQVRHSNRFLPTVSGRSCLSVSGALSIRSCLSRPENPKGGSFNFQDGIGM
jgi:hypothetical protein